MNNFATLDATASAYSVHEGRTAYIQILNQFSNTKSKGMPPNLICIVQAMEVKAEVKLGGLMERVFELEELHRPGSLNKQFDPSRRGKTWRKEAWPSVCAFNAFLIR